MIGIVNEEGGIFRWNLTSSGEYSVKSGYDIAYNWKLSVEGCRGESSNVEDMIRAWTGFCKIRVPGIVKLMSWKLYYNGLPMACNLRARGCETGINCQFCGFNDESTKHIFLDC